MSASSAINAIIGKPGPARSGAKFTHFGETNSRVINAIKEMYAEAAVVFGRWLNVSDKTAKRKLNFERGLTVDELGILIRSERGFEIVAAIMGDAKPAWWRLVVPLMDAAEARKMQLIAKRRMAKTIEGWSMPTEISPPQFKGPKPWLFRTRNTLALTLMRFAQWAAYRIAPWLRKPDGEGQ